MSLVASQIREQGESPESVVFSKIGREGCSSMVAQRTKFSLVKMLGRPFERKNRGCNGASLFGILFLSPSMLSFYGSHLKID